MYYCVIKIYIYICITLYLFLVIKICIVKVHVLLTIHQCMVVATSHVEFVHHIRHGKMGQDFLT